LPVKIECGIDNEDNIDYQVKDITKYKNKNVVILGGGDSAID
jgi:thioredoxin reductase